MNLIAEYIKILTNNILVQELLIKTIGKILLKQDNIKEFIKENNETIIHIRDWIFSVIENNEEWKEPRVLTIEALNNSADKYFEKKNNKIQTIKLNENHEKLIADLDDYYVVQMLTPEALDNESKQMQHCIGHGYYDEKLKNGKYQYLSLRDKFNKAHVTLEINENKVLQLRGKQNELPDKKYLFVIIIWLNNNGYTSIYDKEYFIKKRIYIENNTFLNFDDLTIEENVDYIMKKVDNVFIYEQITEKFLIYIKDKKENYKTQNYVFVDIDKNIVGYSNKISDKRNKIHKKLLQFFIDNHYNNIPYTRIGYIYNYYDHKIYSINKMPDNCIINGDLYYYFKQKVNIPKNLTVNGDIDFTHLYKSYASNKIDLSNTDNLIVNNLNLYFCYNFCAFPKNLVVKNSLFLNMIDNIKDIPENIKCKRLNIDKNQINLIKESMEFEEIDINFDRYERTEFFEKFKEKLFIA